MKRRARAAGDDFAAQVQVLVDQAVAEQLLERVAELLAEADQHQAELDRVLREVDRLLAKV